MKCSPQEARVLLEGEVEKRPGDSAVLFHLCMLTFLLGEIDRVRRLVKKNLRDDSHASMICMGARLAAFDGKAKECDRLLERAIALDPTAPWVVLHSAKLALKAGDPEQAIAGLTAMLSRRQDPNAYGLLVMAHKAAHQPDKCLALLDQAPDWFKGSARWEASYGTLCIGNHEFDKAETCFRNVVAKIPTSAKGWAQLAGALNLQGKIQEAEEAARFANDLLPSNALAVQILLSVAKSKGKTKEVQRLTQQLNFAHRIRSALAYEPISRQDAILGGSVEVKPSMPLTQEINDTVRMRNLIDSGKWDEASQAVDNAVEAGFRSPALDACSFLLAEHDGRTVRAREIMEEMLSDPSKHNVIVPCAVRYLFRQGDKERAAGMVEELIQNLPNLPLEMGRTVRYLTQVKQLDLAKRLHAACKVKFPEDPLVRFYTYEFAYIERDFSTMFEAYANAPHHIRGLHPIKRLLKTKTFRKAVWRVITGRAKRSPE